MITTTSQPRAVRRPLLALLGSVAALLTGLAAQEVRDNTAQLVAVVTEEVSSGAPELLLSERGPLGGATEDVCGVCGGDSTRCLGCDGAPSSGHRRDVCGVFTRSAEINMFTSLPAIRRGPGFYSSF